MGSAPCRKQRLHDVAMALKGLRPTKRLHRQRFLHSRQHLPRVGVRPPPVTLHRRHHQGIYAFLFFSVDIGLGHQQGFNDISVALVCGRQQGRHAIITFRIYIGTCGEQLVDPEGRPFGLSGRTTLSLCGCGQSQNKPLCDGSHKTCGFAHTVEAREFSLRKPKV